MVVIVGGGGRRRQRPPSRNRPKILVWKWRTSAWTARCMIAWVCARFASLVTGVADDEEPAEASYPGKAGPAAVVVLPLPFPFRFAAAPSQLPLELFHH